jgi:hypothetical protein
MNRSALVLVILMAVALAEPSAAVGQLSMESGGRAVTQAREDRSSVVSRLAPSATLLELLPPAWPRQPLLEEAKPSTRLVQARVRNRRGVPLMVAGGILFVAGAIVGDDVGTVLMLGGAGVGAYGAYVYFGG